MKFKNVNGEIFEVKVSRNDNPVKVKKSLAQSVYENEKKIQLLVDASPLDDNKLLFDSIDAGTWMIDINILRDEEARQFVILNLCSNAFWTVDCIQVHKTDKISSVRQIISNVSKLNESGFFYILKEDGSKLDDEATVTDCQLYDNICLYVVFPVPCIYLTGISDRMESWEIKDVDLWMSIEEFKLKIVAEKAHREANDIVLLLVSKDNTMLQYLHESQKLFQYRIRNHSLIKYIEIIRLSNDKNLIPDKENRILVSDDPAKPMHMVEFKITNITSDSKPNYRTLCNDLDVYYKLMEAADEPSDQILKVYGLFKCKEKLYFGMEPYEESLKRSIDAGYTRPDSEFKKCIVDIINGLQALLSIDVLFCDLRCENILLINKTQVKLSVLSNSTVLNKSLGTTGKGKYISTSSRNVFWQAPEAIGDFLTVKGMIWSLGAMVYEMYTGRHPYSDMQPHEAASKIREFKSLNFDLFTPIPEEIRRFIECCTKPEPEDRISLEELLNHEFLKS